MIRAYYITNIDLKELFLTDCINFYIDIKLGQGKIDLTSNIHN